MKKYLLSIMAITMLLSTGLGIAYAAFKDTTKLAGSSFSVGSADIKLVVDLAGGIDSNNLTDQKQAPSFTGISPNWSENYLLKLYNNATTSLQLASNADYLTANDPDDLRSIIYIEPFNWSDSNNNGQLDDGELGSTYGKKTITKWKTEGFSFGTLNTGEVKGMVLRFSTDAVSDTKQGKTGMFDFIIDAVGL